MLNYKIISIVVLIFFTCLVNAQTTNNEYKVTYLEKRIVSEDQLKKINVFPVMLKEQMLKEINIGQEKFLFINNDLSLFSLKEKIKTEKSVKEEYLEETVEKTSYLVTTDHYKSFNDSSLVLTKNIQNEIYVIKAALHPFKWKLIDETKYLESMNCKKAVAFDEEGDEIEAWYTEDIPISNGPSIYGGLPGLIIELKTKYNVFSVKNLEETNTEEKINFPSIENSMTMEEFKKEFNPNNSKPKKSTSYN